MNAPTHPAPAGVSTAEHGVNTTSPPETEYEPWPVTDFVVNVQPDGGESLVQNRIVGDVKLFPVAALSFAFTLMV